MQIIRSNRRTLSLTVTRDGEILVRAPYGISDGYISEFIRKHRGWIAQKSEILKSSSLPLADGNTVSLFGSDYTICTGTVKLTESKIFLPETNREKSLTVLLKKLSLDVMRSFTEAIASRYGFAYQKIRISSARGRWGSCNRNAVIAYSFRIAFLSPDLCEYVAVHELAHTVQMNHGKAFWEEVANVLPDWKDRRKRLNSCGTVMNWL